MKTNLERIDNMKRNKGFTLIELLAVIVILAIIALIAVPTVMNIITKAQKSAFKDSAYGIIKAGELYYTDKLLEPAGMTEDKTFIFPNNMEGLEINGSKPTGGSMIVSKKGKVSMAITDGRYCVTKGYDDNDVTISDDPKNCEIPGHTLSDLAVEYTFTKVDGSAYETPTVTVPECITNKTKCDAGTPVAIKVNDSETYKFYVLNETDGKVELIMDRNLYAKGNNTEPDVAWISIDDYTADLEEGSNTPCYDDACTDKGPLTALRALKERTHGWTNILAYNYTLENDEGGTLIYPAITGELVENVRARLPKYSELISSEIGCKFITLDSCPSWIYENLNGTGDNNTSGYWTSTTDSAAANIGSKAYYVRMEGYLASNPGYVSTWHGIRPVITLSK